MGTVTPKALWKTMEQPISENLGPSVLSDSTPQESSPNRTIYSILSESIRFHNAAVGKERTEQGKELLRQAYMLRAEAHSYDPDHVDSAWEVDKYHPRGKLDNVHDLLMDFYRGILG
jgi:hypothetical protein